MKVSIWAKSDRLPALKLIWEGSLDFIPHIGQSIGLDGVAGTLPIIDVVLLPDNCNFNIGSCANVIVNDLYGYTVGNTEE